MIKISYYNSDRLIFWKILKRDCVNFFRWRIITSSAKPEKRIVAHKASIIEIVKEGEENFVGDSEIIALGGASNETKDRPLG